LDKLKIVFEILFLLFGFGAIVISRFLLRNHPKMTGDELGALDKKLDGIHHTYLKASAVVMVIVVLFSYLAYQKNQDISFVLIFSSYGLFDGLFALKTRVFPTTIKNNWNSFFYDRTGSHQWIAWLQAGLSIGLLIINCVFYNFIL